VPQRQSTPQAPTRSSEPVAPVGMGGTDARTPSEARSNLGVPGLADNNTFTGNNTHEGTELFDGTTTFSGPISLGNTLTIGSGASVTQTGNEPNTLKFLTVSSALRITGGLSVAYVAKTADYTITEGDVVVDVTANSPTITLPTAVGVDLAHQAVIIKNSGAGTVTLATTSSQTIDGAAPGTLAAGEAITLVSTGANWIIV
jgi:hypothetical protein